jgi:hypothetical protein
MMKIAISVVMIAATIVSAFWGEPENSTDIRIVEMTASSEIQAVVLCNGGELRLMDFGGGLGFLHCDPPHATPATYTIYAPFVAKGN